MALLRRVENSRLLLHSKPGNHQKALLETFSAGGIDPTRIRFTGHVPERTYLLQYGQMDIALDTTPFAGGMTNCDALYMGVPVVSLSGATAVGRMGAAMLRKLGMDEFIAHTPSEYVQIAAALATDTTKLLKLRGALRDKMLRSPLMDQVSFANSMQAAFRSIWVAHCSGKKLTG